MNLEDEGQKDNSLNWNNSVIIFKSDETEAFVDKKGKIRIYIFNVCRYENVVTDVWYIYCCFRAIGHLNTLCFSHIMNNQTRLKFLLQK